MPKRYDEGRFKLLFDAWNGGWDERLRSSVMMRTRIAFASFQAVLLLAASQDEAQAALRHWYRFAEGATADAAGRVILDSIGDMHGVVKGTGSSADANSLALPGGPQVDGGAYVDLPNGMISALDTDATFEAWFTINSTGNNWSRVFDFGDAHIENDPPMPGIFDYEIDGPGLVPGWINSGDTFYHAPVRGTNLNLQRTSLQNPHPESGHIPPSTGIVGAADIIVDTNAATSAGVPQHLAVTYIKDADGSGPGTVPRITVYRNGAQIGDALATDATAFQLENLNDVNNWLGRSNFSVDSLFSGSFHEFRIYDHALTSSQVASSFLCGGNGCGSVGDYNLDGRVNTADYTVYRNRLAGIGGTNLPAEADPIPGVDVDDYIRWKGLYGVVYGNTFILGAAVPEPTALVLILALIMTLAGTRSCTWRQRKFQVRKSWPWDQIRRPRPRRAIDQARAIAMSTTVAGSGIASGVTLPTPAP
jgi:hypothetical protein